MYELIVHGSFAAAHNLRGYEGLCENLHGHNWRVTVTLASDMLNNIGMVMDFKEVKAVLAEILDTLDHAYLNEVEPFTETNPTTENMARHIAGELAARLPENVRVTRVEAWESEKCGAAWIPDPEDAST